MIIEAVTDLVSVFALLERCDLKHCDISEQDPPRFFGIRQGDELLAVIGFEPFGAVGLLRSLAVAPSCRGQGLAHRLIAHLEAQALAQGVTTLYLLTNSADTLFRRLGYVDTARAMAPDVIRATSQFSGLCPSSSVLMSKHLLESARPCLMQIWHRHEGELTGWLTRQLADRESARDLLHELFLKALRQGGKFCSIENGRAWLFEVARNAVADQLRRQREMVPLPEFLPQPESDSESLAVDSLVTALPYILAMLSEPDRQAIILCDLEGMTQQAFAEQLGLTLPAAKSRVQRARTRLREQLTLYCGVQFDAAGRVCCIAGAKTL